MGLVGTYKSEIDCFLTSYLSRPHVNMFPLQKQGNLLNVFTDCYVWELFFTEISQNVPFLFLIK